MDSVRIRRSRPPAALPTGQRYGFPYLSADEIYLDSACQTLRPQPVIDALTEYYREYGACGERTHYAWGKRVDERVSATRDAVVRLLALPPRRYRTSFTLNTTYGINLLLLQLPVGRYTRIVTSHTEHNSVFVPVMRYAQRAGVPRILLGREPDGALRYSPADLERAIVVVSAMNNVDGTVTPGLDQLVADTHRAGGIVIVDAAQAASHAISAVRGIPADAICFSAHKIYGASLGVTVAATTLLEELDLQFVGGGQVAGVGEDEVQWRTELESRLEPGLQAWGEIIALGAALDWLDAFERATGQSPEEHERALAEHLFAGLAELPHVRLFSPRPSGVLSIVPERVDAHRLAVFLSKANISVRSGYFCAHHWLRDVAQVPPLVRFSLGAHNTLADVERTLEVTGRLMKGL